MKTDELYSGLGRPEIKGYPAHEGGPAVLLSYRDAEQARVAFVALATFLRCYADWDPEFVKASTDDVVDRLAADLKERLRRKSEAQLWKTNFTGDRP